MYGRRVAGRTLTFGVSEWLEKNAQVLYDRETDGLWSHATGICLAGPLKGKRLERFAGRVTPRIAWQAWRALYPRTLVLSVDGREDNACERYEDYRRDPARVGLYPVANRDRRLPAKMLVVGVVLPGGDTVAYPLGLLARRPLVTDRWSDNTPFIVLLDNRSGATAAWKIPPGVSTLTRNGNVLAGPGGRRWQALTGRALGGADLVPVPHTRAYWFAWSAFHPRTRLVAAP